MENYEKKYKDALERAKNYHKQLLDEDNPEWAGEIENIFPELKESEDEKIRKALIRYHQSTINIDGIKGEEILAWLEKQVPKPKWSDDDEELLQHCCGAVAAADYYTLEDKEEMENWLKTIKQRMGGAR